MNWTTKGCYQPISPTHLRKISWGNDSWKGKNMILAALRFLFPKKMPPHLLRPTNLNPKTNTTDKVVKPEPGGFTFHKNGHLLLPRHHRSVNVLKSRGFSPKAESCCHQAHGHHGHPLAWTAGNVGSNIGILCLMPLYLFTLFTASVSLDSCQNLCFALYVLVGCRPPIVLICISLAVLVPSWNICESL